MDWRGGWPSPIWTEYKDVDFCKPLPDRISRLPRPEIAAWLNAYTRPDKYVKGLIPALDVIVMTSTGLTKPVPQVLRFDQSTPATGIVWPANPFVPKRE